MTEVILFIIVGGIAITAAVMMLLSENAVHSALFLIVNFACVAFLYLMLDAPFLAMMQIAVYAGAIMVLFLFVIMLLGAEKLTEPTKQFRWLAPLALALSAAFLLIAGVAITSGQIDLSSPNERPPMLRIVHAAPYAGPVDVYANGELLASNVTAGKSTDFHALAAGDTEIALNIAGTSTAAVTTTVSLPGDNTKQANGFTAIAYGGDASTPPQVALVQDNLETVPVRTARVSIFNGYPEAINLVDFGSETDPSDDKIIVGDIQPGATVELPPVNQDTSLRAWAFTSVNSAAENLSDLNVLARLNNPDVFTIKRDSAELMVVGAEQLLDGTLRAAVIPLVNDAVASFGGPSSIAQLLFTRYLLPFQLIAVLLLAAMVGAIVLTHKESFVPRRRDVRRKVAKPLTSAITDQVGHDVLTPDDRTPKLPEKQPEPSGD
jgi:NADH-quinone oxidoreductase subunit J